MQPWVRDRTFGTIDATQDRANTVKLTVDLGSDPFASPISFDVAAAGLTPWEFYGTLEAIVRNSNGRQWIE